MGVQQAVEGVGDGLEREGGRGEEGGERGGDSEARSGEGQGGRGDGAVVAGVRAEQLLLPVGVDANEIEDIRLARRSNTLNEPPRSKRRES